MATPKQVQLRGGTSEEHNSFVGAPREITIDTTNNTIRVHDGKTLGGYAICRVSDLITVNNDLTQRINDMQENLGGSHNHDDRYALKDHNHDDRYYRKFDGGYNVSSKIINGYHGLCSDNGGDGGWYRTTMNGLLPYKSGGYSSIGSSDWKFNEGWFNTLNSSMLVVHKRGNISHIEFPAQSSDPGYIRHIESNNKAGMYFSVSDDMAEQDTLLFGASPNGTFNEGAILTADGKLWLRKWLESEYASMTLGGRYIYFDGQRPSNAPDGSISFG